MDEAASDTRDKKGVVDDELDSFLERLIARNKHGAKFFGLGNGAWKTVENETIHD